MTFIPDVCTHARMGGSNPPKCSLCGADLGEFRYQAMPEWNVSGPLCSQCYEKKLLDHYIAPDRRGITKK